MKKIIYYCAAVVCAICSSSCSENVAEEKQTFGGEITLYATQGLFDGDASSRTALAVGNLVNWSSGDQFSVFDGIRNNQFSLQASGVTESSFVGSVTSGTTKMYGLYPYTPTAMFEGNTIFGAVVPERQYAVSGNFDKRAVIMTACTETNNIPLPEMREITRFFECCM